MNAQIRREIRKRMIDQGLNQEAVAAKIGTSPSSLSQMLSGHRGKVPAAWARLLDALDLELTIKPKNARAQDSES